MAARAQRQHELAEARSAESVLANTVAGSTVAVHVVVDSSNPRYHDPDDPNSIVTDYAVRITHVYGAALTQDSLSITQAGGQVGEVAVEHSNTLLLEQDARYVLLLENASCCHTDLGLTRIVRQLDDDTYWYRGEFLTLQELEAAFAPLGGNAGDSQ